MSTRERVAVQRAMAAGIGAVTERVIGVVLREIPAYATVSATQREEISAIARWALQRTVEMWVDESPLSETDLRRFRGIGAARATDGRPLPAILRAYRVAAVEIADLVVELGRGALDVDDLAALNRTMLTGVDTLSEALFAGYEEVSARLRQDRDQVLATLSADLLAGRQTSRAALADRSARLGITLPPRFTLTVVAAPVATPASAGVILAHHATDHTAFLTDLAVDVPPGHRTCVVGDVPAAQLPRAYRLASTAVAYAPARAFRARPWLDWGDVLAFAVLTGSDADAAEELPATVLGVLLEPANAHLLDGLTASLDEGSAVGAADALGVHPQTVRHRLRRARALTGRHLDDPWDRLVLDVARTSAAALAPLSPRPRHR